MANNIFVSSKEQINQISLTIDVAQSDFILFHFILCVRVRASFCMLIILKNHILLIF